MRHSKLLVLVSLLALSTAACSVQAAELKVGDPAPGMTVGKWIKGEPVTSIDKDKVYVLEFWATWCGPCIQAIPHVTKLQAKHPDVVFIGVNVWEDNEAKVEPFVTKMGDKMNYRVVLDDKSTDPKGAMAKNWLDAAGQDGIPCSMIVDDGNLVWIGHPMAMDKVLDQVAAGKYDIGKAKKEADDKAAKAGEMDKVQTAVREKVGPLLSANDHTGAAKAVDGLISEFPTMKPQLLGLKLDILLSAKDYDAAYQVTDEIAVSANEDAESLNALAWMIVDRKGLEKRDLDRAAKYATRAVQLTQAKEAAILDTLARVYAEKGDLDEAIDWQTKAIAVADDSLKPELQKILDGYKAKQQ
jgi:thiol-disulfide isomerase/thioredoxin